MHERLSVRGVVVRLGAAGGHVCFGWVLFGTVVACPGAYPSTLLLPRGFSLVHVAFFLLMCAFLFCEFPVFVEVNGALEAGRRNCGFPASCESQSNVSRDAPVLYCIASAPFLGMLFAAVDLRVPRMGGHFLADLFWALDLIF